MILEMRQIKFVNMSVHKLPQPDGMDTTSVRAYCRNANKHALGCPNTDNMEYLELVRPYLFNL